jgi:hypothetical protein
MIQVAAKCSYPDRFIVEYMYLPNMYSTRSNWQMFKFKLVGSTRLLVHI